MAIFRSKSEKYITWMNLDPSLRFRMLVGERANLYKNEFIADEAFLEKLYQQKLIHEEKQNALIKSCGYMFTIIFLLSNGGDLTVPGFSVKISELPSLLEISLFMYSLGVAFLGIKFLDIQSCGAIIDGVITAKYGKDRLKNHIIRSSMSPESSFWIMFQKKYFDSYNEKYIQGRRAQFVNSFYLLISSLILLVLLLVPTLFVIYVAIFKLSDTYFGWSVAVFSILCSAFALLTFLIFIFQFPHDLNDAAADKKTEFKR